MYCYHIIFRSHDNIKIYKKFTPYFFQYWDGFYGECKDLLNGQEIDICSSILQSFIGDEKFCKKITKNHMGWDVSLKCIKLPNNY